MQESSQYALGAEFGARVEELSATSTKFSSCFLLIWFGHWFKSRLILA